MHPLDAVKHELENNALVTVSSEQSSIVVRLQLSESQQQGCVFIPMHWNDQFSSKAYVDALVGEKCDPISGQPEFKNTAVNISAFKASWYGFLISRRRLDLQHATYWVCSKGRRYWRYELAGNETEDNWPTFARNLLCTDARDVNWVEYFDAGVKRYRAGRIENNRLESCVFIGPDLALPERDWLAKLFASDQLEEKDRNSLLTGKPADAKEDAGKIICACFGIGINTIKNSICENKLTSAEEIGASLKAGTNCGSCVPELKKIIKECRYESKV